MHFSDYVESGIFNHMFRDPTWSKPGNVWIALTTGVLLDAATGATIPEMPNANGYARVNASGNGIWNDHGTAGPGDNVAEIAFPVASANWAADVSGVALVDQEAYGTGNVLMLGDLNLRRAVVSGDTFKFNAGELDITIA